MPSHLVFVASDMVWPADTWFKDRQTCYLVASEVSKYIFYRGISRLAGAGANAGVDVWVESTVFGVAAKGYLVIAFMLYSNLPPARENC